MPRAAVICEFNPFHHGHKFLLEKIKSIYADEIVCIMSGSFVQRGDIAITDKFSRAEAALQNGADMVVELPVPYAVSSARSFAENGVRIAAALHCDKLCFGAEDSLDALQRLTELLDDPAVNERIRAAMQRGQYYPKALSLAVGEAYATIIEKPNNILALEYIRACRDYAIEPVAIERRGVMHDDDAISADIASASKIRGLILSGEAYRRYTPMTIDRPCTLDALAPAILYRLKTISPEELSQIADVSEGLEHRFIYAAKQYNSLQEIYNAVKTKRYTMARIRRITIAALLHITATTQNTPVPYCRVLGMRTGHESILTAAELPLIIKAKADYERLDISAKEIFDTELRATEAMNLAKGDHPINEFTQPIIKKGLSH